MPTKSSSDLQARLHHIQTHLNAPKSKYNSFGRYNYRTCEDILEAVKKLLDGVVLTLNDEMVMLGDRFYVKATARISDGTESIEVSAFAREALTKKGMDESQITGASSSYARKYALNGLFCIDDTKDADHPEEGGASKVVTSKEKKEIERKIANLSDDEILDYKCPMNGGSKYSGHTIKTISNNITDAGLHVGLGFIEKVIDSEMNSLEGYAFQKACERFYNEIVNK